MGCRDDLDYLPVLASLPPEQTVFEYLVGCWKRLNVAKTALIRRVSGYSDRVHFCIDEISAHEVFGGCRDTPPSKYNPRWRSWRRSGS